MFTQRQTPLSISLSSVATVLLLLTTTGRSVPVEDTSNTTTSPVLTTEISNSTVDQTLVPGLHRPCGEEHSNFCQNGGQCMYPQDSQKPFCICTSSYRGPRCLFFIVTNPSQSTSGMEQLIAVIFSMVLILVFLAFLLYCVGRKKCKKSAALIKSPPSETSV